MRKNKLIELLQSIEGNPHIYLWNGYVGDYQDIKNHICPVMLVKQTPEEASLRLRYELMRDGVEDVDKELDNFKKDFEPEWELNPYVSEEHIKEGRYKAKKVHFLTPVLRGKVSLDRVGEMEY